MQVSLQNWLLTVMLRKLFCFQESGTMVPARVRVHAAGFCWHVTSIADCIGHRTGVYTPPQVRCHLPSPTNRLFPVQKLASDSLHNAGWPQRTQIRRLDGRSSRHYNIFNDVSDDNYDVCTAMPGGDTSEERRFSPLPQL